MRPRAVAWDIDGTLADSEPLHLRALLVTCLSFGADLSDMPEQEFLGIHLGDVWRLVCQRLPAELEQTVWLEAVNHYYVAHQNEVVEMPGAAETVRRLGALGIRQACVSNSERVIVDANLDALGIADAFDFTISVDDVTQGKPFPEPYLRAAEKFSVPPHEILAVEDSVAGIVAAKAAGLRVVGYQVAGAPHIETDQIVHDLPSLLERFA